MVGDIRDCNFTIATGDRVGTVDISIDPRLGPLQDNGGPTQTHALLPDSPAIDAGNPAAPGSGGNACEATDQRGVARPVDGNGDGTTRCDIGAYELDHNTPPVAFGQIVSTAGDTPISIKLTGSDPDTGDSLTFIIVSPPANGDLFEGATITGDKITTGDRVLTRDTVTYEARLGFASTESFGFKANDGTGDSNVATVTVIVTSPTVKGTVNLEAMPNPISGARITFSTGGRTIASVFSDPENGSFEIQLTSGIYDVKVEKDGFLPATKMGVAVDQNMTLPEVVLLWGDVNRDGVIGIGDLVVPAKNMGKTESPWQ